jgi:hypothetical protein
MKRTIFTLAAAAFLLTGAYQYAHAAERTDCKASFTEVIAANQGHPGFTATDILPSEQAALIEAKGPPPGVSEPYTIALASATVNGVEIGLLLVHDGDCALTAVGPAPLPTILNFIGRRVAGG